MRRKVASEQNLVGALGEAISVQTGVDSAAAQRMAHDVARHLARPIAELLTSARLAIADHVLLDGPFDGAAPGEEQVSTELHGMALDYAASMMTAYAAALEMADHYGRSSAPTIQPERAA